MKKLILISLLIFSSKLIFGQINSTEHLETGWYLIVKDPSESIRMSTESDPGTMHNLSPKAILLGKHFSKVKYSSNSNPRLNGLEILLDKEGKEKWNLSTKHYIGLNLGFVVDNKLECVWFCDHQTTNGIIYITTLQLPESRLRELASELSKKK
jgi:preprotein translocase subunit SecD